MEWNGGSETMEEVMARIHQREEAAGKRERAMAYAFSHQVSHGDKIKCCNCSCNNEDKTYDE